MRDSTLVVGAGYFGEKYVQNLANHCVAIVDKNVDRLRQLSSTYNVPTFQHLEEVHQSIKYTHVIIATPPENHCNYAHHFATEGKYVLVEKPFVTSTQEAEALLKFRDKIMVGHIYTYNPGIQALKEKMREIPIHHIFCRRTNDGPVRPWQNSIWDLAPHDISICNYLLDQSPIGYDIIDGYDYGIIKLEYIACQAVIYVSWLGGPKVRQVELVPAQKGDRIIFDDLKRVQEVSPLHLMLNAFFEHKWNQWCTVEAGLDMIKILEQTND